MNVLSMFYKNRPGGFSKRLYQLYGALADKGHHVCFIGTEPVLSGHRNVMNELLQTPCQSRANSVFWLSFAWQSFHKALEVSEKHAVTRIVTFAPFYTFLCLLPILRKRIPAITFIRADNMLHGTNRWRNRFFYVIDRLGLMGSNRIIFVSSALMEIYRDRFGLDEKKLLVLPNNIERNYEIGYDAKSQIRRSLGMTDDDFVLSSMGVLNPNKNFELILQAMRHISDTRVKFMLIGDEINDSGERKRLENLARSLSLNDRVVFCGWQHEPIQYIASSDLFVFPSRFEGSPNALLEALSCGIPCIGSDIPEIREILFYPDLLFSLKDDLELRITITRALNDEGFRLFLKARSRERCAAYTFDWNAKALEIICN